MKIQPHLLYSIAFSAASSSVWTSGSHVLAFTPITFWKSRNVRTGGIGAGGRSPPCDPNNGMFHFDHEDEEEPNGYNNIISASMLGFMDDTEENDTDTDTDTDLDDKIRIRGGSTKSKLNTNDVIAGSKSSLQMSQMYWTDKFQSLKTKISEINLNPFSRGKKKDKEEEIDPTTIRIQAVIAPESDVLPENVVRSAAQRSGMLGDVMRTDRVKECARQIKKWYAQRGYVLHSVTGATLYTDNATAIITVQEPILSDMPLDIRFAKMMLIDPESGQATSKRKYREKVERRRGRPLKQEEWTAIARNLNSTLVEAKGLTNPHTISKRMGMYPGRHFKWDGSRWTKIAQSGIFAKIWRAGPVQMADGTVQMQVLAQESPPRNLEYGVSKSLYTGHLVSAKSVIPFFMYREVLGILMT